MSLILTMDFTIEFRVVIKDRRERLKICQLVGTLVFAFLGM